DDAKPVCFLRRTGPASGSGSAAAGRGGFAGVGGWPYPVAGGGGDADVCLVGRSPPVSASAPLGDPAARRHVGSAGREYVAALTQVCEPVGFELIRRGRPVSRRGRPSGRRWCIPLLPVSISAFGWRRGPPSRRWRRRSSRRRRGWPSFRRGWLEC